MRHEAFLIKYAEIGLKGNNRRFFEDALVHQIKEAMKNVEGHFAVSKASGRIYVSCPPRYDEDDAIAALQRVFGIRWICPVVRLNDMPYEELEREVVRYISEEFDDLSFTFKVECKRTRKSYPVVSQEMNARLGEALLNAYPGLKVDVHHPDVLLRVEVRDEYINVYAKEIPGLGGMPLGSAGKALLLLSGGIDSPVAGYMVSRRGVNLEAVYFHAPPYTSERAKEKVVTLARKMSLYTGPIKLHVINFTAVQLLIYERCPHDELTIIMRRYMMRIAEAIAKEGDCLAMITGESVGQVASQTMESMNVTNRVAELPVYRPLIAFDKQEIVEIAEKIDTYETSILPYEDCCTVFVAKHPVTKPTVEQIEASEELIREDAEALVREALETREILNIAPERRRRFDLPEE